MISNTNFMLQVTDRKEIIMNNIIIILILSTILKESHGIIGFDCASKDPIIQTYSLVDAGDCDFKNDDIKLENVTITLLQQAEFRQVKTQQCKIEIKRTIYNCGMFSYLSPVENVVQEYLYDISQEQCKFIHETGIFKYDNVHTISDLKVNSSISMPMLFAGVVEGKSCTGAAYADHFGTWTNVIVQGTIRITLVEEFAAVNLDNDKIRLNSGTVCKFSDQHCIDILSGYVFWNTLPTNEECLKKKYDVLYLGPATRYKSESNETIYNVRTMEYLFSYAIKEKTSLCNRIIYKTEHPKLFIYEKDDNIAFDDDVAPLNNIQYNLFTYMNLKFVYVERHFRNQMRSLYLNILKDKCELEQKVIRNALSIASISPDLFAYDLMQKPGYIARLAGEAVHIIKCSPVIVDILQTKECYAQLPVKSGNKTMFLTPKTHILIKTGTQINCDTIIPQYYKIGDKWITLTPEPRKTNNAVQVWKANKEIHWKSNDAGSLATAGIYSQTDLDKLQRHLMFPIEREALLTTVARGMQGEVAIQGDLITNLLTENTLAHIAEKTWNNFIEKFITFGSISAGIFTSIQIFYGLKTIIDTTVRGYTLHQAFGWSVHLIGAIFGSITSLLMKRKKEKEEEMSSRANCDTNIYTDSTSKRRHIQKQISNADISIPISKPNSNPSTVFDMELHDLSNPVIKYSKTPPPIPKSLPSKIPNKPIDEARIEIFNLEPM